MRALFGVLAVLLGQASICLTGRYGYKSAGTVIDGAIGAVVFSSIALCAFLFDAAAVRLRFMKHYVGSALIGSIKAAKRAADSATSNKIAGCDKAWPELPPA